MSKKILKTIGVSCLLFSSLAFAVEKNNKISCREIYPNICNAQASCSAEEKEKLERLDNFCLEIRKPDNFMDETLKKLLAMEKRVLSKEDPEVLKKDFVKLKEEVSKSEIKIIDGVKLIRGFAEKDEELPKRLNSKTSFYNKELAISNMKGFLVFVMGDHNIDYYRKFYNDKIKIGNEEKGISDFRDQVLTKKECVNLMFHTLKTYKLNDGIEAIREVTELLDKQGVKCK